MSHWSQSRFLEIEINEFIDDNRDLDTQLRVSFKRLSDGIRQMHEFFSASDLTEDQWKQHYKNFSKEFIELKERYEQLKASTIKSANKV